MESFTTNYREFHKDTTRFCDLLPETYKKGSPYELQDVRLIPSILPTSDFDMVTCNYKEVAKKFSIVRSMMDTVIHSIQPFVEVGFNQWLIDQGEKLTWWMNLCSMSLGNVKIDGRNVSIEIYSAGIGGINIGNPSGELPKIWKRLEKLEAVIKAGPSKTIY